MSITKEQVIDALRYVDDPDLKKDLVTLNMVRDVEVSGKDVSFTVVLTTPACPMKEMIHRACVNAIIHYVDKDANVKVNMTSNVTSRRNDGQALLPGVKNIIAVASGKGGVGKSTVAANLAIALAKNGASVGLIDADIFGPSQPIMFGATNERLFVNERDGKQFMVPLEKYGVKLLSIGFLVDPDQAIVWRGPMASKALRQLFSDADWGELDYMLIDLPPGTSDIHLTLVSAVPVTGAIIVSTPQNVALADARKGIGMFKMESVKVPVLGLVENMAYFTPAELPDHKYYIFGKNGAADLAKELSIPLLGQIPLVQSIREGGDNGLPAALDEATATGMAFMDLAKAVAQQVAIRNANMEPTKPVPTLG
ncbi:MAG: Mrp/NBP35 family ATP-binding protein [Bacteroidia bacterium]